MTRGDVIYRISALFATRCVFRKSEPNLDFLEAIGSVPSLCWVGFLVSRLLSRDRLGLDYVSSPILSVPETFICRSLQHHGQEFRGPSINIIGVIQIIK